jgi:hypothetical protein
MEPSGSPTRSYLLRHVRKLALTAYAIYETSDSDKLRAELLRTFGDVATLMVQLLTEDERREWVKGMAEPLRSEIVQRLTKAGLLSPDFLNS